MRGAVSAAMGACGVLWCAWASAQSDATLAQQTRMAIFPVIYGESAQEEPLVAPYLGAVHREAQQAWSGPVLAEGSLADVMELAWVTRADRAVLERLRGSLGEAEQRFRDPEQGPGAAIPALEALIKDADALLPQVSASPEDAERLLRAHLLLWWALDEVGEKSRLEELMVSAAARFPAAQLDSQQVPPFVVEAFVQARARLRERGAQTLVMRVEGARGGECRLLLNGSALGDWRQAALAVPAGRTYYVQAGCGEDQLPARRVVVEGATEVVLDLGFARQMRSSAVGTTLQIPGGHGSAAQMAALGSHMGQTLGVGHVLLVGVVEEDRALQIDRVRTQDGRRTCSVRISLDDARDSAALYGALRAVVANRPTRFSLLFAGEDGVYQTPEDYVENVIGSQRVFTWVAGGLGALTLGAGAIMEFVGTSLQQDLDDCVASLRCRGTSEAEGHRNALSDAVLTRNILYTSGGILLVGAVVLYFVESPDLEAELNAPMRGAGLGLWVSPSGAGVEGRW